MGGWLEPCPGTVPWNVTLGCTEGPSECLGTEHVPWHTLPWSCSNLEPTSCIPLASTLPAWGLGTHLAAVLSTKKNIWGQIVPCSTFIQILVRNLVKEVFQAILLPLSLLRSAVSVLPVRSLVILQGMVGWCLNIDVLAAYGFNTI